MAKESDFRAIQGFYWDVINDIHENNTSHENLGWERGIYPSDNFIQSSVAKGELYMLTENGVLLACVILNQECNEGYRGCAWSMDCTSDEILIPHALAVHPRMQGRGVGKIVVENILRIAKAEGRKSVRLDVLAACESAERLYRSCGFAFVAAREMFYEDAGWTEYRLFERNI